MKANKKVLIVDDSPLIRQLLIELITNIDGFEVVDTAADPHIAAQKIMAVKPDIITLDVEMPKMDGLTFLSKLMRLKPIPVIIISSLSTKNSEVAFKALELGAVDYMTKPTKSLVDVFPLLKNELELKLQACSRANVHPAQKSPMGIPVSPMGRNPQLQQQHTNKIIAIGSSTGGTIATSKIIQALPPSMPGIVITQHMPAGFTKSFADRLDKNCALAVKEAAEADDILPGMVFIAPGDAHMQVKKKGPRYYISLSDAPPINRHKPSVNFLFHSLAENIGAPAYGIILTGMGSDGAEGMLAMHQQKSFTIAQDEASCVVFGMPRAAIEKGGVSKVMNIEEIIQFLLSLDLEKR